MFSVRQSLVTDIVIALAIAAATFAFSRLGLSFDPLAGVNSVWPVIGLITGLLLVTPRGGWRAITGELALQLETAVDAERSRLAHELHDDIAQKLVALKMQLELDDKHDGRSTSEYVDAVDHLISDVRALSRSMRPAPFEEGQLIPALATLARAEGRRAGLRVVVDARVNDVPLSRDVELACYRVVREAVTNIVKHARARHLAVSAILHAGVFAVRVVDDGTGFDVAPTTRKAVLDGHLGLMGMRERIDQVGGTLKIRSVCGAGTLVECRVPLMTTV
jgi:signal transduction histidine kinase